jgi:hypothetical protein
MITPGPDTDFHGCSQQQTGEVLAEGIVRGGPPPARGS